MDWETQVLKWVNEGKVWRANEDALAAVVTAVPTTTAGVTFWNGEPKGGMSYLLLASYAIQGGTPATLNSWGFVHQVSDLATGTLDPSPGAILTTSTSVVNKKGNQGVYGGAMVIDIGETVLDDRWFPCGYSTNTAVVILTGTQLYVPLHPPIELPPGAMYSMIGVGGTNDVTLRLGTEWVELEQEELDNLGAIGGPPWIC